MIKIVHLSSNPVSGSPYELNKLLNTCSTDIQSHLIQGTYLYKDDKNIPQRNFPYDLLWNENRELCIQLIKEADIIHIHNSLFPINLKDYIQPNQKIILQLYSVYREKLQEKINEILELNPIIVIANQPWQKSVYQDLSQIYLPLVKTNFLDNTNKDFPIIVYSPTNRLPLSHIYSKGYYEILEILYRLKQKYNFELKIIEGLDYLQNLKEKENADIIIDDIINENAFHGTSLEASCYGAIALTNYSGEDYPFKKTNLNTLESTLINYLDNLSVLQHDKEQLKKWQKENYNPEILIKKYKNFYESCLQINKPIFENITNPYEKSDRMTYTKNYLLTLMTDWLEKYNISYFLSFGSALKAYRDNEQALDIDLGLFYEDKWKVRQLLEIDCPPEIMINCIWRGEITFRFKDSNYPKLDFIFFDKQKDFYQCNIYSKNPMNYLITWERGLKISHEALNGFKLIEFNNKHIPIPINIELYLKENYTDEWKIPISNKSMGWGSRPCADTNHRQIAIIIPTFIRPQKVKNCIESILNVYPEGMVRIYVGDQSDIIDDNMQEFYNKLEIKGHKFFKLPYNCGLAYARNYLIQQISTEPYILIIDDDFIFTANTELSKLIDVLEEKENHGICGGNLEGRHHYAGWLSYYSIIKKIFKIDIFSIPQEIQLTTDFLYRNRKVTYYYSDSVLNFFLAKKEVFQDIQWDNDLLLVEHLDFMLRLKNTKWNVCYVPEVTIKHSTLINDNTYKHFRHDENKKIGTERFCKKWNLNSLEDIWRFPFKKEAITKIQEPIKESTIIQNNTNPNINICYIFQEVTELFDKNDILYCLLNTTCRDIVVEKEIPLLNNHLYFGVELDEKIIRIFQQLGYNYENDCLIKNEIIICLEKLPLKMKKWKWNNKIYNVPFPLIDYLVKNFNIDFKTRLKKNNI
jgi:GT2 family glycosyltransferase